jgi:hypothetical protein
MTCPRSHFVKLKYDHVLSAGTAPSAVGAGKIHVKSMGVGDLCLFGPPLKKYFVGNEFAATDAGVKQAVTSWPQTLDTDGLSVGIQTLVLGRHMSLHVNSG